MYNMDQLWYILLHKDIMVEKNFKLNILPKKKI